MQEFRLPDPGEGLVEAEIIAWRVAVGDEVKVNDVVLEIETSKSIVELPIPWAGRVAAILVEEGTTVPIGTPVIVIDDGRGDAAPAAAAQHADADDDTPEPLLVGYGEKPSRGRRRRSRPAGPRDAEVPAPEAPAVQTPAAQQPARSLAKPPVRKLARDLGVDLSAICGTGPQGRVVRADVEAAARAAGQAAAASPGPEVRQEAPRMPVGGPDQEAPGGERRVPVKGVRKVTAQAMVDSVSRHVHVTEWVTVDVTATMQLVERLKASREYAGLRVSPLLFHARAVCLVMGRHPDINASWSEQTQEIVYHDDVNLGIAAATPRGLMVPTIRRAQRLGTLELCRAITELVQVSKEGRLQPADYAGGTFTITNVGVFGIESGTPIINGDESAILCMGAIERRPWVVGEGAEERIEPRWVTTLALSFDHRLIDGEQGSRFLREVADLLHDPARAMLY